jgi:hypothetical protein
MHRSSNGQSSLAQCLTGIESKSTCQSRPKTGRLDTPSKKSHPEHSLKKKSLLHSESMLLRREKQKSYHSCTQCKMMHRRKERIFPQGKAGRQPTA